MLNKRYYEEIADILKKYKYRIPKENIDKIIKDFCIYFQNDNPNFNKELFLKRIGEIKIKERITKWWKIYLN